MARYHIGKNGPAKCSAQIKCRLQKADGSEPEHYNNKAAAQTAWERELSAENGATSTIEPPDETLIEKQIEELEEWDLYTDYEKQEMFDDAVMGFDGAREIYAEYLAKLPEAQRKKELKKYQSALKREESWDYY